MHPLLEVFCVPAVQNLRCSGVDQVSPLLNVKFRIEILVFHKAGNLPQQLLSLCPFNYHARLLREPDLPRAVTDHRETRPEKRHCLVTELFDKPKLGFLQCNASIRSLCQVRIEPLHQGSCEHIVRRPEASDYTSGAGKEKGSNQVDDAFLPHEPPGPGITC